MLVNSFMFKTFSEKLVYFTSLIVAMFFYILKTKSSKVLIENFFVLKKFIKIYS